MIAPPGDADRATMEDLARRVSGLFVGVPVGLAVPVLLQLAAHYAAVTARDAKSLPRGIPLKDLRRMLEASYFGVLRRREGLAP